MCRRTSQPPPRIECGRSIDVGKLNRNGCLVTGWAGSWQWTRDGNQVATIGLAAHQGSLRLTYRWRLADNEWNDVDEREQKLALFVERLNRADRRRRFRSRTWR
jgi:hypothetical protein